MKRISSLKSALALPISALTISATKAMSAMKPILVLLALSPLLTAAACAESSEARLDHAQILAVRAEPAHVAPGGRARIDVLAGDDAGAVFVAPPDELAAASPSGPLAVERTDEGWFVTAGSAPGLATLDVTLAIDGFSWRARKVLVVGEPADNPRVLAMQVDGSPSETLVAAAGSKPELAAIGEGREPLTYAWYSSVGDLERYRQPSAVLDATEAASGHVLLVVRDEVGGVGWHLLPARVE
jgi:hypothetical protein